MPRAFVIDTPSADSAAWINAGATGEPAMKPHLKESLSGVILALRTTSSIARHMAGTPTSMVVDAFTAVLTAATGSNDSLAIAIELPTHKGARNVQTLPRQWKSGAMASMTSFGPSFQSVASIYALFSKLL
jgi:hypothetical protein